MVGSIKMGVAKSVIEVSSKLKQDKGVDKQCGEKN